jgi:16S rRNA (guanine966-N2)-methyltransferase
VQQRLATRRFFKGFKMRITGGQHLNRSIAVPQGDAVRPATDKVRAAVFNILMHRREGGVSGVTVLDLCSGSGAYGLEALSRGAATCTFVDTSPVALAAVRSTAGQLGCIDRCTLVRGDIRHLPPLTAAADLVFCDPPYALAADLLAATLPGLLAVLAPGALVVLEGPNDKRIKSKKHGEILLPHAFLPPALPAGLALVTEKSYGNTMIALLRKESTQKER